MSFLETVKLVLRALYINKIRSMLTVLGIIVGVAAVVCVVSVGSGAREEVAEKLRTLGANLLLVRPGAEVSGGARSEIWRWAGRQTRRRPSTCHCSTAASSNRRGGG